MLIISHQVSCWEAGPYDDHMAYGFKPPKSKYPFGHGYDSDVYGKYEGHWRPTAKFDREKFDEDFHLSPPSEYSDYRKYAKKLDGPIIASSLPLLPPLPTSYQNVPIRTEQQPVKSPEVVELPPPIYYDSVVNYVPKSSSVSS